MASLKMQSSTQQPVMMRGSGESMNSVGALQGRVGRGQQAQLSRPRRRDVPKVVDADPIRSLSAFIDQTNSTPLLDR